MKNKLSVILTTMLIMVFAISFISCGKKTQNKLESNSLIVEGEFSKGVSLNANKVNETSQEYTSTISKISDKEYDKEKVAVYDISLVKDNAKVQPNGKVKITMPIPFESKMGYVTYHLKGDVVEELKTTIEDDNITFETTSFSYFIITSNLSDDDPNKVTSLILDAHNAGFSYDEDGKLSEKTVVKIGAEYTPNPENVLVYGVTTEENKYLVKDADYLVDLGGLDITKEGTYTITYTYKKNQNIKVSLIIEVVDPNKVTSIILDAHNAGFSYDEDGILSKKTVVKIGAEYTPNPENVLVYGVTAEENKYLAKDADYLVDLGGLDFTKEGTYTITYTYKKNQNIKVSLIIEVVDPNKVTSLILDAHNAGFSYDEDGKLSERTVVKIGAENTPNPENVLVYGVTAEENKYLVKDADYLVDLGGLDFTKEGTYTITYTYIKDTNLKITLTIEVIK